MTNLNDRESKILRAIRNNPELENCILEMIEITQVPLGTLDNGDEAEEAVVNSIRKTGKLLMQEWANRKNEEAHGTAIKDSRYRPHGKKK